MAGLPLLKLGSTTGAVRLATLMTMVVVTLTVAPSSSSSLMYTRRWSLESQLWWQYLAPGYVVYESCVIAALFVTSTMYRPVLVWPPLEPPQQKAICLPAYAPDV